MILVPYGKPPSICSPSTKLFKTFLGVVEENRMSLTRCYSITYMLLDTQIGPKIEKSAASSRFKRVSHLIILRAHYIASMLVHSTHTPRSNQFQGLGAETGSFRLNILKRASLFYLRTLRQLNMFVEAFGAQAHFPDDFI